MKVETIYQIIHTFAPFDTQMGFDNAGLLIGSMSDDVHKVGIALDATNRVIDQAAAIGCDFLVIHHPIIFEPMRSLDPASPAIRCVQKGMGVLSAHTNADAAVGGVNDQLAHILGIEQVEPLSEGEQPPLARMGVWRFESACEMADALKEKLDCHVRYVDGGKAIRKVALCGGSGGDYIGPALQNGCDALIVGECKHNHRLDAQNRGLSLFECGHYNTEKSIKDVFYTLLTNAGCECVIIDERDPADYR